MRNLSPAARRRLLKMELADAGDIVRSLRAASAAFNAKARTMAPKSWLWGWDELTEAGGER
jgi:hypothetical protein